MKYTCFDMKAYKLHVIETDKFKTVNVDVSFRRKIKKEEITIRNLVKELMISSSSNYPTERSLIIESERLYDLKLISQNYRVGNYSILSLKTKFLDEKFTEDGMNEESIKFLLDLIFNPKFDNSFLKCKKKIENSILSLYDAKVKYALLKLLESASDKVYSYNLYGYLEDLNKINIEDTYKYYDDIIKNDIIDVFVVGDVDADNIKELFKKYFKAVTFHREEKDVIVSELDCSGKVKNLSIKDDVNQSQVTLLYGIKGLTDRERKYVLPIYGEMLGGGSNSLLFDAVREKNSYAYYVSAFAVPYDNVMMIYSGVDSGNQKEVIKIINKSLNDVSHGKFSLEQFENAKTLIRAGIISRLDSSNGIISSYYAKELLGSDDFETKIKTISEISKDEIVSLSKKIKLYSSFILEASDEKDSD